MTDPKPTRRRFCPTPGWLVLGLVVVEGLLWLSERFQWFAFNEKKGWTVLIAVASVGAAILLTLLWLVVALVFHWRFQFSLRSLLVLTVAVAIACSWMAVEMKKAREQREVVEEIVKGGGYAGYDYDMNSPPWVKGTVWLRVLLGNDFFNDVIMATPNDASQTDDAQTKNITNSALHHLEKLPQLQMLTLAGTQVDDGGLLPSKGGINFKTWTFGKPRSPTRGWHISED